MEIYSAAASSSFTRDAPPLLRRDASFSDQAHLQFYGSRASFLPVRRRPLALPSQRSPPLLQDRALLSSSSSPSTPFPFCAGMSSCSTSCAEAFSKDCDSCSEALAKDSDSCTEESASLQQELLKELAGLKMQMKQKKKELKAKMKESKKAMKAAEGKHKKKRKEKMMEGGSASSSESSDSECDEGVDMRLWRKRQEKSTTCPEVPVRGGESQVKDAEMAIIKEAGCAVMDRKGEAVAQAGRVEVCVGGKCKRAGSEQLLSVLRSQIPESSLVEAMPCKCMGRCAMAMNVRVQKYRDGVEQQHYHSHASAADAPLILSHHFGIGGERPMSSTVVLSSPPLSPHLPSLPIALPA